MGSETLQLSQKPGNTGKRSCTVDDLSFGPAPVCRRPEADCGEVEGWGRKEWKGMQELFKLELNDSN